MFTMNTPPADELSTRVAALEAQIRELELRLAARDAENADRIAELASIHEALSLRDKALEHSDEAIAIFDVRDDGFPLVYVNGGFERQTGYTKREALGQSARFIHGPDTDMATVEQIRGAFRDGREWATDLLSYRKDGTPYWNRVTLTPLRDDDGRVTHFVAVQTDITAHVQSAREVRQALELLEETNAQLTKSMRRIKRNLEAAAKVQQAMLPERLPKVKGYDFAWRYVPSDELAGDILNIFRLDSQHIGMYLLDVSGHGTAAALLAVSVAKMLTPMSHATTLVREHEHDDDECEDRIVPPSEVAERLNRQFPWDPETSQFFTLIYGVLDTKSGAFRYISAGHPAPLLVEQGQVHPVKERRGFPIGLGDGVYEEYTLQLQPGQRMYLYSDGLTDTMSPRRELFGKERLAQALQAQENGKVDASLEELLTKVEAWRGRSRFSDDISMVAVEYTAEA